MIFTGLFLNGESVDGFRSSICLKRRQCADALSSAAGHGLDSSRSSGTLRNARYRFASRPYRLQLFFGGGARHTAHMVRSWRRGRMHPPGRPGAHGLRLRLCVATPICRLVPKCCRWGPGSSRHRTRSGAMGLIIRAVGRSEVLSTPWSKR
jgi:hypothetical protein